MHNNKLSADAAGTSLTDANAQAASDAAVTICIEGLSFAYDPGRLVLTDVSGAMQAGRVTMVLGPNAAGKTTLLRLLLGQLTPTSGQVRVDQQSVANMPAGQRARHMAYVPQFGSMSFGFTVRQVVAMGQFASPAGNRTTVTGLWQGKGTPPATMDQLLHCLELSAEADRVFSDLSGGTRQRVLLARAIWQLSANVSAAGAVAPDHQPGPGQVLVLDEPTSHMDLRHAHSAMQLLAELARAGVAVVMVGHDLHLAGRYANDVWLLADGRLAACGPADVVLVPDVLEPVYDVGFVQVDTPMGPVLAVSDQRG